ncbi:MAG: amidohydrolase [Synergistaceae bacterium]|nr:amidohydrolase [Synergistaceae bacterium]
MRKVAALPVDALFPAHGVFVLENGGDHIQTALAKIENIREGKIPLIIDVKTLAQNLNSQIVKWRRRIHQNPELGSQTPQTEDFIVETLKKIGADNIETGLADHGVVALIEGRNPGKILGIRADIDALNIKEETGLSFASTNNFMHACGHDAHTAMLLGAGALLVQLKDHLPGSVKLIFQPAEENGTGARAMIEAGVLDNPKVDAIIGLHTGNFWPEVQSGEIGYRFGSMMAATDWFSVTFHGKSGHAAAPHLSVDPISIACHAVALLQTIVSRETNPLDSALISVCTIKGGTAKNVIAPNCVIEGTLRSLTPEGRRNIQERFTKICEETAVTLKGSADVTIIEAPPALINDPIMTEKLRAAAALIVGEEHVREIHTPVMTGEDIAFYFEKVPGTFFFHPSTYGDKRDYPHHHSKFDINEDVLWIGTATFVQFALTWQQ